MLKEATTNTILPEASEELIGNEPWTIEVYADGLMDEIFADVEDILEGKGELNSQPLGSRSTTPLGLSQFKQKSKVKTSPIVNPETPGQVKPVNSHKQPEATKAAAKSAQEDKSTSNLPQKSRGSWGKSLSITASLGLALAGLTWLIYSGLANRLFAEIFAEELRSAQIEQGSSGKVDPQTELVNYMLGALAVIEEGETQDNSSKNVTMAGMSGDRQSSTAIPQPMSANSPGNNLPPVRAANNLQPTPSRSTKVVERVYIPVYQAPPPMRYTPPSVASTSLGKLPPVKEVAQKSYSKPSKSNTGKTAKNTVPKPKLTLMKTELKPVEMGNKPITVGEAPKPKPAIPPKLTDAKPPTENNPPVQHQEVAVAPTQPSYELLGVMELGEKSAALFKIEGITRRIHKGENIGSSGWTLVDVSDNEIVVRRNGEVRSIQTGQKI